MYYYIYSLCMMSHRHTVNLNDKAYIKLKQFGAFGESYSQLVLRLLETIEKKIPVEKVNSFDSRNANLIFK